MTAVPESTTDQLRQYARLAEHWADKSDVTPFYLRVRNLAEDGQDTGVMTMGTYANPQLAQHSDYFSALDGMMKCVEHNKDVQGEQA